jgi:hypothetical protein
MDFSNDFKNHRSCPYCRKTWTTDMEDWIRLEEDEKRSQEDSPRARRRSRSRSEQKKGEFTITKGLIGLARILVSRLWGGFRSSSRRPPTKSGQ